MAQRLIDRVKARRDSEGGFTLIELLVVIIILGILAAVVVFSVSGLNNRGEEAACEIDRRTLATAAEANYAENGDYTVTPANWNGTTPPVATDAANLSANIKDNLEANGFIAPGDDNLWHTVQVYDNDPGTDPEDIAARILVSIVPAGPCDFS